MSLCQDYLAARGINDDTVKLYGIELDDRLDHVLIKKRLGQHLPKGTIETLWFPLCDAAGNILNWIARPLPSIAGHPKFLCAIGSGGFPYVPKSVYGLSHGRWIIVTEGPIKALAIVQAGFDAIGINGVWGAGIKNSQDCYVIRSDLLSALDWRGRKVYVSFDADYAINPDVRQAMIRLFFLLSGVGAEVYQLTNWDLTKGKGIDDFLVNQFSSNGQHKPEDVLAGLVSGAKPFIDSIQASSLDLALIKSEFLKVQIPDILRSQLTRPLAARLGIPVEELRKISSTIKVSAGDFVDPDPWPYPVDGNTLLGELTGIIDKHIVVDDHSKVAIALWTVVDYLIDVVDIMPLLAITSPEKRCGKTTLLELLMRLVRRPMPGVSLSPATVFRSIEKWHPTLLIDEADGLLKNSQGQDNVELRNVINSGHSRAFAFVPRCEGDSHEVRNFSTWSPKVIALIGKMPDSMADRSIHIEMKRKAKSDSVSKLRETLPGVFEELRRKIIRFVNDNAEAIKITVPSFPAGLNDRAEDCWSPLLAISEIAGANWIDLAWRAAVALSGNDDLADTFTTILLRALKQDFEDEGENHDKGALFTSDICSHLNADDEAPWQSFKNQMTPELLARHLRRYKIKSERIIISGIRQRGLWWRDLEPIFNRYL